MQALAQFESCFRQWLLQFREGLNRLNIVYALLYLTILFGIILRISYIADYNPLDHIWSDPQRHWEQGSEPLRNDPMTLTDPILYQLYIGIIAKLTFKDPVLVAFYAILLSVLTPWIWYRYLRELFDNRLLATAGWAVFSILPSWIVVFAYFMQETLLLPLLGLALWASWRCKRKQTVSTFVLMVFLWILTGLTRGIAIPLAAVICTWMWFAQNQKFSKASLSLLLMVFIMGPLTYRTYQQMHIFAPHGDSRLVGLYARSGKKEIHIHYKRGESGWSYAYGSPSTGARPFAPLSNWQSSRRGIVRANIDVTKGTEDWKNVFEKYPLTFSKYLWLAKENMIFLFFGPSWPDNNTARTLDTMNVHLRWVWAPLLVVLVISICFLRKKMHKQWLLPSVLLAWLLVQGLVPLAVNEGRYRKPGEGLMIAQAFALAAITRRRRQEEKSGTNYAVVAPIVGAGCLIYLTVFLAWRYSHSLVQLNEDGIAWLSEQNALSYAQDWGEMGRNVSVEGKPLSLNGKYYEKGLGVHAESEVVYRIPKGTNYFFSYYGLDKEGIEGKVSFSVWLDDTLAFNSGPLRYRESGEIFVDLKNAKLIKLRVDPVGDNHHDHANWAMARFLRHKPTNSPEKADSKQ